MLTAIWRVITCVCMPWTCRTRLRIGRLSAAREEIVAARAAMAQARRRMAQEARTRADLTGPYHHARADLFYARSRECSAIAEAEAQADWLRAHGVPPGAGPERRREFRGVGRSADLG